jgi:hypothetical protein
MLRIGRLRCCRREHVRRRNLVSGRIVLGSVRPVNENHRRGALVTARQMPPNAIRMAPAERARGPTAGLQASGVLLAGAHPQANPMLSRSLSKDVGGACPKLWQEQAKHASVPCIEISKEPLWNAAK